MLKIIWANGDAPDLCDDYQDCLEVIERSYPDYWAGHDGDLSDGGDRTLIWANEADSIDDDGQRAVASVVRAG